MPVPCPAEACDADSERAEQARANVAKPESYERSDWRAMPYDTEGGAEWLNVAAVRDVRKLSLSWQVPSQYAQ